MTEPNVKLIREMALTSDRHRERFDFVTEKAGLGYWDWDIEADRLEWTVLCKRLFGLGDDESVDYARFLATVHPDDRQRTDDAVRACLVSEGGGDYDIEYRVVWPDGSERWIHAKGGATFSDGKAVRMAGIAVDITLHKNAIGTLQRQVKAILDALPLGVALLDKEGRRVVGNPVHEKYVPHGVISSRSPVGRECWHGFSADGAEVPLEQYPGERALRGEKVWPGTRFLYTGDEKTGPRWVRISALPLVDGADRVQGAVVAIDDIDAEYRLRAEVVERERQLRLVADTVPILIAQCDRDLRYTFVNRAYASRFGLEPADVLGKRVPDVIGEGVFAHISTAVGRCLAGETVEFEVDIQDAMGLRHLHCTYVPEREDGRVVGFVAAIMDMTDRHTAEQALAQSEQRLRLFIERAPVGIAVFDLDMRFLAVSRRYLDDYLPPGTEPGDLIGRSAYEVFPEIPDRWRVLHRRVLAGESLSEAQDLLVRPDGRKQWVRWEMTPWMKDGAVSGLLLFAEDVTERLETSRSLAESEARFAAAVSAGGFGVYDFDLVSQTLKWNEVAREIWGYAPDDAIDYAAFLKGIHPDDRAAVYAAGMAARDPDGSRRLDIEYRVVNQRTGKIRWVHDTSNVVVDGGTAVSMLGVAQDITERKRNEDAAAYLAAIVTGSSDAIISKSLDGTILSWNRSAEHLFGYTAKEMIGTSVLRLIPPELQAEEVRIIATVSAGASVPAYDTLRLNKDGNAVPVSLAISPIRDAAGTIVGAAKIVRDISERRRGEEALHKKTEQLEALIASAPIGIAYFDRQQHFVQLNAELAELNGRTTSDPIGRELRDVLAENAAVVGPVLERVFATGEVIRNVEIAGQLPQHLGGARNWLCGFFPVHTPAGEIELVGAWVVEITDRKRAEERERLLMREVSHRAKNVLAVAQAIARMTARSTNAKAFGQRFSERLMALSANQDVLVRNEWQGADIEGLVKAQLAPFADIERQVTLAGDHLKVTPAAGQSLGMALHELATNASKHGALSQPGGHLEIRWGLEGDTFAMSWVERGGPPVKEPKKRGFGSTVITTSVESTLEGTVELMYAATGVTWRVSCPAEKVLTMAARSR